MRARVVDWQSGQIGVELGIASDEIAPLMDQLASLRRDRDEHFHIRSDGREPHRLGDLEIYVMAPDEAHNVTMTGLPLAPGEEVREPRRRWWIAPPRSIAVFLLATVGILAGLSAAGAAYIDFITNDYRPILVRGVWEAAAGLLALHASAVLARGWKARIASLLLALLILVPLATILERLSQLR